MKNKRLHVIAVVLAWATTLVVSFIAPSDSHKAAAAPQLRWTNAKTIHSQDGSVTYLDTTMASNDKAHLYFKQGGGPNCPNKVEVRGHDLHEDTIDIQGWRSTGGSQPSGGHKYYTLNPPVPGSNFGGCTLKEETITIADNQNSTITYDWVDKNTIRHFYAEVEEQGGSFWAARLPDGEFKLESTSGKYVQQTNNVCKATIQVSPPNVGEATITLASQSGNSCTTTTAKIRLAYTANYSQTSNPGGGGGGGGDNNSGGAAPPASCETINASFSLAWLLCGFLGILDGTINSLDKGIQHMLIIDMAYFNDPRYVQAWGAIRNIALLILVPIMLVMVISTALDFGPFSPRAVRKALPRFLFAVLFIVTALPVLKFFIQLSNVVTSGIIGLLSSAFQVNVNEITLQSLFNPGNAESFGIFAGIIASGAAAGGAYVLGFFTLGTLFSLAVVSVVGLLIGWLVLVIRVILIVALPLAMTIAIITWIFED